MPTAFRIIAATLVVFAAMSSASAEPRSGTSPNRALHRAIAMQGDQALLDIRTKMADAIEHAIRQQMETALPLPGVSLGSLPVGCPLELSGLISEV